MQQSCTRPKWQAALRDEVPGRLGTIRRRGEPALGLRNGAIHWKGVKFDENPCAIGRLTMDASLVHEPRGRKRQRGRPSHTGAEGPAESSLTHLLQAENSETVQAALRAMEEKAGVGNEQLYRGLLALGAQLQDYGNTLARQHAAELNAGVWPFTQVRGKSRERGAWASKTLIVLCPCGSAKPSSEACNGASQFYQLVWGSGFTRPLSDQSSWPPPRGPTEPIQFYFPLYGGPICPCMDDVLRVSHTRTSVCI